MRLTVTIIMAGLAMILTAQEKPTYRIFTGEGKSSDFGKMIKNLEDADVVFFGELHDDPIAHWLELEVTKSLFGSKGKDLILGAEIFETDNQLLLNEYITNAIDAARFEAEAKLWKNYKTDYKPLVEFARKNNLPFIATNVPRRYASIVNKSGFEGLSGLSQEAKKLIVPLPFPYDPEVKCYKDMLSMGSGGGTMPAHTSENLPKAQAVKDATMAYCINSNWTKNKLFLHYNGSYHSRNFEGIIWYLRKNNPGLKIMTIETVQQENPDSLEKENLNIASYIVAVSSSMTRTY
jgi:uncharacterized iron-regulated protein